jgi:hypothetical protein
MLRWLHDRGARNAATRNARERPWSRSCAASFRWAGLPTGQWPVYINFVEKLRLIDSLLWGCRRFGDDERTAEDANEQRRPWNRLGSLTTAAASRAHGVLFCGLAIMCICADFLVELRGFEPPTPAVRAPPARNVSALPRLTAEGPLDPTLVDAGFTCPSQGQGAAGE